MGRYYNGDINGKFWYGIQDSDDALHFGAEEIVVREWSGCRCEVEGEDPEEGAFCTNCHETLEEAQEDAKNENWEEGEPLWAPMDGARYQLTDMDAVQEKVDELEALVGHMIEPLVFKYGFEYEDVECTDDYVWDNISKDDKELIARLCFGRQILECMKENGVCTFWAEY
jgi:hypothetical protein